MRTIITFFFGTLNVQVPIILSHVQENVHENVKDILRFRRSALLVIDYPTVVNSRLKPYVL